MPIRRRDRVQGDFNGGGTGGKFVDTPGRVTGLGVGGTSGPNLKYKNFSRVAEAGEAEQAQTTVLGTGGTPYPLPAWYSLYPKKLTHIVAASTSATYTLTPTNAVVTEGAPVAAAVTATTSATYTLTSTNASVGTSTSVTATAAATYTLSPTNTVVKHSERANKWFNNKWWPVPTYGEDKWWGAAYAGQVTALATATYTLTPTNASVQANVDTDVTASSTATYTLVPTNAAVTTAGDTNVTAKTTATYTIAAANASVSDSKDVAATTAATYTLTPTNASVTAFEGTSVIATTTATYTLVPTNALIGAGSRIIASTSASYLITTYGAVVTEGTNTFDTIDGEATYVIDRDYQSAILYCKNGYHSIDPTDAAAATEVNDLTASVTWDDIPIANVPTGTTSSTVALGNHVHEAVALNSTGVANNHIFASDGAGGAQWINYSIHTVPGMGTIGPLALSEGDFLTWQPLGSIFVAQSKIEADIASRTTLSAHIADTANPHSVTAAQASALADDGSIDGTGSQTFDDIVANGDISAVDGTFTGDVVLPKTSGNGIKVDTTTPTFPWHDLIGQVNLRGKSPQDPLWTTFRGNIQAAQFDDSANNEVWMTFHVPHDYVAGTDMFIHAHWGHNSASVTTGSVTWSFDVTYAKGYDQAAFPAEVTCTASQSASTTQYQHMIAETQMSVSGGSGTQVDSDDLEVDGLILVRITLSANTISAAADPFLFTADIHYQSSNVGTKDKNSPFYT